MTPQQLAVQRFHERYGYPVGKAPCVPPDAELRLRNGLLAEEVAELERACGLRDLTGIADALGDLLYVVYGTAVVCGIDLGAVFDAIHRSNMTKTPTCGPKPLKGTAYEAPRIEAALAGASP